MGRQVIYTKDKYTKDKAYWSSQELARDRRMAVAAGARSAVKSKRIGLVMQCPSHPPEHSLDTAGCCPACLDDDCVCDEWDIVQGHWNYCIYFQSFFCNGKDTILCDGCPNAVCYKHAGISTQPSGKWFCQSCKEKNL